MPLAEQWKNAPGDLQWASRRTGPLGVEVSPHRSLSPACCHLPKVSHPCTQDSVWPGSRRGRSGVQTDIRGAELFMGEVMIQS